MILNSEMIKEKAEQFRSRLTETEALVAESLVRGVPLLKIPDELGIPQEEFTSICKSGTSNAYFWMLVALVNSRKCRIYRDAYDHLKGQFETRANSPCDSTDASARTIH